MTQVAALILVGLALGLFVRSFWWRGSSYRGDPPWYGGKYPP